MKGYDISVIISCFNEGKNIPELITRLQDTFEKRLFKGEIVLVNDGSTDNTGVLVREFAKKYSNVKVINNKRNLGLIISWRKALEISSGEYLCFLDADLQFLPEDVWRLFREIKYSLADLVQAVRSPVNSTSGSALTFNKLFNSVINVTLGTHFKDEISSVIICRRIVMIDLLKFRGHYFYFQSFLAAAAIAKGYQIREVEVLYENRLLGKQYLPNLLLVFLRLFRDLLTIAWEFFLFPKPETILAEYLQSHRPRRQKRGLSSLRKLWFRLFLITMPFHHWMITRQAGLYYAELSDSQWLLPKEIKELQEQKLHKLIDHAYYHVNYYRDMFDRLGLKPTDIQTIEDLRKLPLLSKSDIRENLYFDLISTNYNHKRILKITTSGSTGEPFVCYADKHQLEIRWAATLRSYEWTGYRFGDRQVRLWHQTLGMTRSQIIREYIDAWLNRRLFIPAYEMNDENLAVTIEKIKNHKPLLIDGYSESFNFLARYFKDHEVTGINPKGIISSAQIMPKQSRQIIEKQFKCKVFDKYGSREFSGIAYECEAHRGHHVVAENYIVEILKDNRPAKTGEIGEIVITDLNNYCLPFIRYRIGDLATAMNDHHRCPCGRGLPRIGDIEGRVQAIIIGANGNYVPGTFFAHIFKDYDYLVRQYQVIQEELGAIDLKIVKALRFDEKKFDEILLKLRHFLGTDMKINVIFVEKIPLIRTGKHQGSISKLKFDFQSLSPRFQS